MPTYEYACTACGKHLEVVQSFTDSSLTECPTCEGVLRKVFSPVGVVFKGSGFYKTDSRAKSSSSSSSDKTSSDKTSSDKASSDKTSSTTSSSDTSGGTKSAAPTPGTSSGSGAATGS